MAALGRPEYINIRRAMLEDKSLSTFRNIALSVLDAAYDHGIRYFDTAPSYGKGESFLLDWYQSRGYRDVVFGTKWGYTYKANWELGYDGKHEIKEHSLSKLLEQWEYSKNLRPALKFYQIHSATMDSGVLENRAVHQELMRIKKETGMKIGLTASGKLQSEILEIAMDIKIDGEELFDSFQVTFNVLEQSVLRTVKEAQERGKSIIIKEGLANGRIFPNSAYPNYQERYKLLVALSEKYGVGIDAVALRYCMQALEPDYVLSGAGDIYQLMENLKAGSFELSQDDMDMLKEAAYDTAEYWEERRDMEWN